MSINIKTLFNGKKSSPEDLEKKFQSTRSEYLKDLDKLRKKYASKLLKITTTYGTTCL